MREDYYIRNPRSHSRSRASNEIRLAAQAILRAYGVLTASRRVMPDYLVIGGKRCGSTTVAQHLQDDPQVLPLFPSARFLPMESSTKGVHFFDTHYDRGVRWYRSHFPLRRSRQREIDRTGQAICGEASPYYLFHPDAAARAASVVGAARIVVLLRDPVTRAWSHFREQRKRGNEWLQDFEDALSVESQRLAGEWCTPEGTLVSASVAHEHLSYRLQGEYVNGLRTWFEHFDREQILVVPLEPEMRNLRSAITEVREFLGLGELATQIPQLNRLASMPVPPAAARDLARHYDPLNRQLEELVGRAVPW